MRRYALLICVLAGLNLALTPMVMPHAHVHSDENGDHADVFVHGGHDHDFAAVGLDLHDHHHADDQHVDRHHVADYDRDHDDHHDYGDGALDLTLDGDVSHIAHAHIVHLDASVIDPPSRQLSKAIAPLTANAIERPPCIGFVSLPSARVSFVATCPHLLPPLRGPPASIRNVA